MWWRGRVNNALDCCRQLCCAGMVIRRTCTALRPYSRSPRLHWGARIKARVPISCCSREKHSRSARYKFRAFCKHIEASAAESSPISSLIKSKQLLDQVLQKLGDRRARPHGAVTPARESVLAGADPTAQTGWGLYSPASGPTRITQVTRRACPASNLMS